MGRNVSFMFAMMLILVLTLPTSTNEISITQTSSIDTTRGPYVDKIVHRVVTQYEQQVSELQNGQIDLIGGTVDPTFRDALSEEENIEMAQHLRNGYGFLSINCDKYPFNITAFRRAFAFALDKEAICEGWWDGLAVPQDSLIPQINPFSIEGQLPYTYYEANTDLANQLLDAAGFLDIDEDNFREAPNGMDFDVLIEFAQPSVVDILQETQGALRAVGINATATPTDFYDYLNRLYFHGDYDIVFLGTSYNNFNVDWIAYEFWSEYADEPYWNFPNWRNATFDSYRDALIHSVDYDEVYEAAIAMQEVWVYECPYIILYENVHLSAYRTDKFEGYVNDARDGVPGWWTNYGVRLKDELSGPYGGTFVRSNPLDVDSFNFMRSSSTYTMDILEMLYDSLLKMDAQGL
ncbi:MAG: ABC transporter substrate-binding protein [Candidatus Thorarchaeota archaeon]|nr:ABC transporter substrate-binding protein [Candidatus Thorarchaeota archaeon]